VSMRDRATAVAGLLTVRSAPGEGTTIELEVPGG
jgi:signal transduction histidine kinase